MSKKVPGKKIFAVIIAYNAEKTIENIINEIPLDWVDDIVVSDDCSNDNTYNINEVNLINEKISIGSEEYSNIKNNNEDLNIENIDNKN